jgi:hypothetical protein
MKKKMMLFAWFFYTSLVSINLFSQGDTSGVKKPRHELDIIIDDVFAKSPIINYPFVNDIYTPEYTITAQNIPKIGLGYKFNFNHSALRAKFSYGSGQSTQNYSSNSNSDDYSVVSMQISLGYEFQKNMKKLQLFYGLDLFFNYTDLSTTNTNVNNNTTYISKDVSLAPGYGASPFVGVKYFVLPNLSISTEINFTTEKYKTIDKTSYTGCPETTSYTYGSSTHIGPLGNIGINIHF